MFVNFTIHDTIRYTIQKNQKSIHVLTAMVVTIVKITTCPTRISQHGT